MSFCATCLVVYILSVWLFLCFTYLCCLLSCIYIPFKIISHQCLSLRAWVTVTASIRSAMGLAGMNRTMALRVPSSEGARCRPLPAPTVELELTDSTAVNSGRYISFKHSHQPNSRTCFGSLKEFHMPSFLCFICTPLEFQ